jgi:Ca-activated chloride channel family protein
VNLTSPSRRAVFRRGTVFVALLLLCGVTASTRPRLPRQTASSPQGTISVETALVVLPVRVTGANGDFLSGLTQEEFRVYEDGRPQAITFFEQEDTPVTVGLVVDHSRSMGPKLPAVAAAV